MVQWTISSDERRELKRAAVGSKFAPANFGEGSCHRQPDPSPKNPSLRSEFFDPPSRGGLKNKKAEQLGCSAFPVLERSAGVGSRERRTSLKRVRSAGKQQRGVFR